ncbi:hypothetical protein PRIPAC_95840 [Pristionchus pacificus]|uniref:Uncharacterized protein n=1 Tax=Pristionchus pacificus TaxID=54126 RepID=A0A2A6D1Y8_PRIPA|nr:hypothetical protein PRIPAC_95840 [Pristionchus pacificus]|eukprot:PDM84454.1 hypothetical protein PRIPAC_33477 [Pristionchus pacificus]
MDPAKDSVAIRSMDESAIPEDDDARPIYEMIEFPPSTEHRYALERIHRYLFPAETEISGVQCRRCEMMRRRLELRREMLNVRRTSNERSDGRVRRMLRRAMKTLRELIPSRQRYNLLAAGSQSTTSSLA